MYTGRAALFKNRATNATTDLDKVSLVVATILDCPTQIPWNPGCLTIPNLTEL